MTLTVNAKTYTADSFGKDAVGYIGPAQTGSVKDTLVLRRTAAKPTKTFSGVVRGLVKLTRTHTLTNALNPAWDSVTNVDVSLPVGVAAADVDAICDDLASHIGSASFKTFLKTQKINF